MKSYLDMSPLELAAELDAVRQAYNELKAVPRKLDMSRGKPNPAQLDLSMPMLALEPASLAHTAGGADTRNYGLPTGIDECKALFADILGLEPKNIIVGGQSSLNLMYDSVARATLSYIRFRLDWPPTMIFFGSRPKMSANRALHSSMPVGRP